MEVYHEVKEAIESVASWITEEESKWIERFTMIQSAGGDQCASMSMR
jgi:hypothetical protein